MARIRSVHPGLFTDEAFVGLSSDAQVFLIGIWTECDDQGVFEWKPVTLRMRLRPTKDGDVTGLLVELVSANMVTKYESGGREYGAVRNFCRFQRPKKPNSVFPIPDEFRTYTGSATPGTEPASGEVSPVPSRGRSNEPKFSTSSEPKAVQSPPVPKKGEKPKQMERRMEDVGKEINSTINHPTGGEEGGRPAAPPQKPGYFDDWLGALSAIDGVKGSGLEMSAYSAMIDLKREGFDLHAEIIPLVKADIAKARDEKRLNRLTWGTLAKRVREARERSPAPVQSASAVKLDPTVSWDDRMSFARRLRKWPAQWGPKPNEPGCLVPETLVLPSDGKDWGEWKPGEAA